MKKQKDKIKKFDEKLKKHIDKKDLIQIYRTVEEGEANIFGFILDMNDTFLLIQNEEEFYLNGYSIIRKDHFDSIGLSKIEKTFRKILKGEGIIKKQLGIKNKINLSSFESIFKDLKRRDYFAIVECEDLKKPTFTIGEITKVSKKSVEIRHFSPEGIINKKSTKVKFDEITLVKFDYRYTRLYRKYLKEEK